MFIVFVAVGILQVATCETSVTVVSERDCGGTYHLDEGILHIKYHGTRVNDCTLTVVETKSSKKICVYFEQMDIASCETTIKLYGYHDKNGERVDFHTFSCEMGTTREYCPALVTELYIAIKHSGPNTTDEVNMKIACKSDSTYIHLIVGFVALAVVIVAIPVVIVLRYRWKKRKASFEESSDNKRCHLVATLT